MSKLSLSIMILVLCVFSHLAYADEPSKTLKQGSSQDALVVVVPKESQIESISKDQLIGIYMGRYRAKDSAQYFQPIDNEKHIENFYQAMIKKTIPQVNSYWARLKFTGRNYQRPSKVTDSNKVASSLLSINNSISYMSLSEVTPDLKVIYEITQ